MKKFQNTVQGLLQIARKNPAGFTVDANFNPITKGYAVATKHTQNSFGEQGAAHALAIAFYQSTERFQAVGGWLNEENGQYYFDAVKIFRTRDAAEKYAQENGQIAFFHLTTGREIKTPPVTMTGGIPSSVGFSKTDGYIAR